jgi:hypothetical protein
MQSNSGSEKNKVLILGPKFVIYRWTLLQAHDQHTIKNKYQAQTSKLPFIFIHSLSYRYLS